MTFLFTNASMNNDYANVIKSIKMTCNSKQAENIERQQLSFTKE